MINPLIFTIMMTVTPIHVASFPFLLVYLFVCSFDCSCRQHVIQVKGVWNSVRKISVMCQTYCAMQYHSLTDILYFTIPY